MVKPYAEKKLLHNVQSCTRLLVSSPDRNLKIGYFSQHHVDQLDLNVCSVELLLSKFPGTV